MTTEKPPKPLFLKTAVCALLSLGLIHPAFAADETWDGDTDGLWSNTTNWVGDPVSPPGTGDQATFNSPVGTGGASVIDLGGAVTINHLFYDSTTVAAFTIGVASADTLTFDNNGGVDTTSAMQNDQTIAADIILGDGTGNTFRIDTESTTNRVIITGDIDTGTGTGSAGVQRLEVGDLGGASGGRLVQIDGDISETGDATRIDFFIGGADLELNGSVNGTGNTQRTIIRDTATATVTATGKIGEGFMEVRNGVLNLNNTTTPQFFDNNIQLGSGTQGNGPATINIAPGATVETNGGVTYVADSGFANLGLIAGGSLSLDGGNRTFTVGDNTAIAGPELTVSSDLTSDNNNRTMTKAGTGTMLLSSASITNGHISVNNGILQFQEDAAWVTNNRDLTVLAANIAGAVTANIEADLNGADGNRVEDIFLGTPATNVGGGGKTFLIGDSDNTATLEVDGNLAYREGTTFELPFDNEVGTDFGNNQQVTGGTSGATGYIVGIQRSGTAGVFSLQNVSGTFQDNETLTVVGTGTGTPVMVNGVGTVVSKLNDRATISVDLNLVNSNSTWTVDDGANATDLVVSSDISQTPNGGSTAFRDLTIRGAGSVALNGNNTHDRTILEGAMTILGSGGAFGIGDTAGAAAGSGGTNAANNQDGLVILRQRNAAQEQANGDEIYVGQVALDINGQDVVFSENFEIGGNTNNLTDVPAGTFITPSPIIVSDLAGTGKLVMSGLNNTGDDNNIIYRDGSAGNLNVKATISADVEIVTSGSTFTVEDGADDVDLEVSGDIFSDNTGGRQLSKAGNGVLLLSGSNQAGGTEGGIDILSVNQGILRFSSGDNLGDNDIQLGNNTTDGTLEYIGTGETINRQFRIGDNNGTVGTRVGDGTILQSGTGTVTFSQGTFNQARGGAMTNRTLTLDGTSDIVISGNIIDNAAGATVALTKNGTNTVVLDGANAYTGPTTVNAGCLEVNGSLSASSAVTVASGACLSGSGTIAGAVTWGTTTTGITLELDGTDGGLTIDSALDTSLGVLVNITGTAGGGLITVLNYDNTEANTIDVADFTLGTSPGTSARGAGSFIDTGSSIVISLGFEDNTWTGTDGTDPTFWDVSTTPNWSNSTDSVFFDGDSVIFGDTASTTVVDLQENVAVGNINFTSTDTLDDFAINGAFTITLDGTLTVSAGDGSGTNDGNDIVINPVIAGDGSLFIGDGDLVQDSNTNSVTLTAANTYTGGTTLQEGRVSITNSSAFGTGTITMDEVSNTGNQSRDPILDMDANGLDVANDITVTNTGVKVIRLDNGGVTANTGTVSGDITNNETGDINFRLQAGRNDVLTASGQISGGALIAMSLHQAEQGTIVLDNANNDFPGNLIVAGLVEVASIANAGIPSHAGAGSLLVLGNSANATVTNNNNQEGNLIYTGGAASTDKQIQVGNFWFSGGHNGVFGGSIVNNGTGGLVFTNSAFNVQEVRVAADIGPRPLRLRGTYTGVNEIDGVIQDNDASDAFDDETVSVEVDTDGTWQLDGVSTYTGPTTVTAGTLLVNGSTAAGSAVTVNGGILGGTGTISGSVNVNAGGSLSPGTSPGTLTFGDTADITGIGDVSSTLYLELDALASTSDLLAVTGGLNIGSGVLGVSDLSITDLGGMEGGTYTIVTSGGITGTLDGADTTGTVGSFDVTLQINGNNLELAVTDGGIYDTWASDNSLVPPDDLETANPDTDTLINLLEFAFGTDPNVSDANTLIFDEGAGTFTPGTQTTDISFGPLEFTAVFIRRVDFASAGLTYTPQFSHNATDWVDSAEVPTVIVPDDGSGYEVVEVDYLIFIPSGPGAGQKARFFRMQVNSNGGPDLEP
ncbi:MAG: autotransporter-associated beta strand repeat-containing protein [Verrucomicrobiota bacterium]